MNVNEISDLLDYLMKVRRDLMSLRCGDAIPCWPEWQQRMVLVGRWLCDLGDEPVVSAVIMDADLGLRIAE